MSSSSTPPPVSSDVPFPRPKPLFFIEHRRKATDGEDALGQDHYESSLSSPSSSPPVTPRVDSRNSFIPATVVNFSVATPIHAVQTSGDGQYLPETQEVQSGRSSVVELSRPGSFSPQIRGSFMSPPTRPLTIYQTVSSPLAPTKSLKRSKSTMLITEIEKPWLKEKNSHFRIAYWLTYATAALGILAAVLRCYFGWRGVPRLGNLCLVMEDEFDTFNSDIWTHEVDMGGFGNGEFEMTTNSPNNSFVRDGKLYIVPTLTSDVIGQQALFNGYTYNLTGCTNANTTACSAVSNSSNGAVINPVQSARITTRYSHNIQFGKVEIRAKLPRGDWLWPALWMLPVDNVYGTWPASGEIDIMEARGNSPAYPRQGTNVVRGSLNWGPFSAMNRVYKTYGYWSKRRSSYDQAFHTYSLEWSPDFMRIYEDTRLHYMFTLKFDRPFWQRGEFPQVVQNGTEYVALQNPWINGTNAAPFDRQFYLIMNLAVGGTSGWFPDGYGNKPWLDGSLTAMRDFALKQDEWYQTWGQGDDKALIIDSVKMWQKC